MKIAVVGSRNFQDYTLLKNTLKNFDINQIISGGARGADTLAEDYAREKHIPVKIFYPDWQKFGKAAGFIRNKDIVKNSDMVIAFWDGQSRGTRSSIELAKQYGKNVKIIRFNEKETKVDF